ncbi:hypothetical protein GCM10010495_74030 [Kitasatospora herbaricolor]|nr:hypothetical protein GCM10010495_74030 [Kitasatospora herbaricolor]
MHWIPYVRYVKFRGFSVAGDLCSKITVRQINRAAAGRIGFIDLFADVCRRWVSRIYPFEQGRDMTKPPTTQEKGPDPGDDGGDAKEHRLRTFALVVIPLLQLGWQIAKDSGLIGS